MILINAQVKELDINSILLTAIISSLLTLFVTIIVEKYKRRITYLKYKNTFQQIAFSALDNYWGDITVTHNGTNINYLYLCTLEITNSTTTDIGNHLLYVTFDNDSQILNFSAKFNESNKIIPLEQNYYEGFKEVFEKNKEDLYNKSINQNHVTPQTLLEDINYYLKNKTFYIPVLNRKDSLTISFLVESFHGNIPQMSPCVIEKSIKLIKEVDEEKRENRKKSIVLILSTVIYTIAFIIIYRLFPQSNKPLLYAYAVGMTSGLLSLLIYWIIDSVRKLFK